MENCSGACHASLRGLNFTFPRPRLAEMLPFHRVLRSVFVKSFLRPPCKCVCTSLQPRKRRLAGDTDVASTWRSASWRLRQRRQGAELSLERLLSTKRNSDGTRFCARNEEQRISFLCVRSTPERLGPFGGSSVFEGLNTRGPTGQHWRGYSSVRRAATQTSRLSTGRL